jgi:hypothetical protein
VVCGFDFGFDVCKFGVGRNIVDKEFGLVSIDTRVRGLEGIDFSREYW